MKSFFVTLFLLLPGFVFSQSGVRPPAPFGPLPSERQLHWQYLEYYAFVHFNMNTFTNKEWGDGKEDPKLFNPTQLDCRQWAKTFALAGMKGIILTAKHHDGFCLWPSKYTDHSVKNSPFRNGKGDVLRELSDACKEYHLKFGVYLSPWDRHDSAYGDSPRYNQKFKDELREVLTSYGDIFEVWFDGANGEGPNGKKQVYDWPGFVGVVRECQPNAVIFSDGGPDIRWVGDEEGYAGETNWSLLRRDEVYPGYPKYQELISGHTDGNYWVPAECDVSIRPGWYYHPDQDTAVKSLKTLVDLYFNSVGRNGSFLLNVPADRRGLICSIDSTRLIEFRKYLDGAFANNLFNGASATASEIRGNDNHFNPAACLDQNNDTYWCTDDSVQTGSIVITLNEEKEINCFMIQEFIPLGQRIEGFSIDAWNGGGWDKIVEGTTIGHKRLLRIPAMKTNRIRLNILKSRACPAISNFAGYFIPPISSDVIH